MEGEEGGVREEGEGRGEEEFGAVILWGGEGRKKGRAAGQMHIG